MASLSSPLIIFFLITAASIAPNAATAVAANVDAKAITVAASSPTNATTAAATNVAAANDSAPPATRKAIIAAASAALAVYLLLLLMATPPPPATPEGSSDEAEQPEPELDAVHQEPAAPLPPLNQRPWRVIMYGQPKPPGFRYIVLKTHANRQEVIVSFDPPPVDTDSDSEEEPAEEAAAAVPPAVDERPWRFVLHGQPKPPGFRYIVFKLRRPEEEPLAG